MSKQLTLTPTIEQHARELFNAMFVAQSGDPKQVAWRALDAAVAFAQVLSDRTTDPQGGGR